MSSDCQAVHSTTEPARFNRPKARYETLGACAELRMRKVAGQKGGSLVQLVGVLSTIAVITGLVAPAVKKSIQHGVTQTGDEGLTQAGFDGPAAGSGMALPLRTVGAASSAVTNHNSLARETDRALEAAK